MQRNWLVLSALVGVAAYAAPGFKQNVPFPAFEGWAKGAAVTFKEAKEEAEAYVAQFQAGTDVITVKIEGAGKFDGMASGAAKFTWKGLEAQYLATGKGGALIAVKYGDSKATLSVTYSASPKARSQADMEKVLATLKPEKILK